MFSNFYGNKCFERWTILPCKTSTFSFQKNQIWAQNLKIQRGDVSQILCRVIKERWSWKSRSPFVAKTWVTGQNSPCFVSLCQALLFLLSPHPAVGNQTLLILCSVIKANTHLAHPLFYRYNALSGPCWWFSGGNHCFTSSRLRAILEDLLAADLSVGFLCHRLSHVANTLCKERSRI